MLVKYDPVFFEYIANVPILDFASSIFLAGEDNIHAVEYQNMWQKNVVFNLRHWEDCRRTRRVKGRFFHDDSKANMTLATLLSRAGDFGLLGLSMNSLEVPLKDQPFNRSIFCFSSFSRGACLGCSAWWICHVWCHGCSSAWQVCMEKMKSRSTHVDASKCCWIHQFQQTFAAGVQAEAVWLVLCIDTCKFIYHRKWRTKISSFTQHNQIKLLAVKHLFRLKNFAADEGRRSLSFGASFLFMNILHAVPCIVLPVFCK